ncbi:hypothetical protein MTP99_016259 [Tenebrio molitor]|nr:hypothetical protein MTP99_016259 [Tenebrio molitor]
MNAIHLVLGVLLDVVVALQVPEGVNKTEKFIYDRCKNNTDAATLKKVQKTLTDFYEASKNVQNICPDKKNQLVQRMEDFAVVIQPCFASPEEKYLPTFLDEGFFEFMELVCANRTFDIYFSGQGIDCREALEEYPPGRAQIEECSRKLFQRFGDEVVQFEALCRDLKSAEECFGQAIEETCPHFVAYEVLNSKFFQAVGKLCNSAMTFGVNTVGVAVLTSFFSRLV